MKSFPSFPWSKLSRSLMSLSLSLKSNTLKRERQKGTEACGIKNVPEMIELLLNFGAGIQDRKKVTYTSLFVQNI